MLIRRSKNTFAITAYTDRENLELLVRQCQDDANVLIHLDASSAVFSGSDVDKLSEQDNVQALRHYAISWGSYKHLLAILDLCREAVEWTNDDGYIHILSGQDMLTRPMDDFRRFFDGNRTIYLDYREIPDMKEHQKKYYMHRNHLWRFDYRNPYIRILRKCDTFFQESSRLLNKKIGNESNLAQGVVWSSMPTVAVKYVLKYIDDNPDFMKDVVRTHIPEEFPFQTILCNSPFRKSIVNNNLRYYDWIKRNGSSPAYLDMTDLPKIQESDCFFARKVDSVISRDLIHSFVTKQRLHNITK